MPIRPHTWVDNQDFLTATLLNGDLRCLNGQEFVPTGVQFHARRPVYKSFSRATLTTSVGNGQWTPAYQNGGGLLVSRPVGDTGGLYGAWMDPFQTGNVNLRINAGGGLSGTQGGLIFVCGYAVWPTSSGSIAAGGADATSTNSSHDGTFQGGNGVTNSVAVVIDIVDGNNPNRFQVMGFNSSGGGLFPVTIPANSDGSGQAPRVHAHWVSAYPGNGQILGSVPTPTTGWVTASAINAATLNSGVRNVLEYLNMPPVLRVQTPGNNQSLTAAAANVVNLGAASQDTYNAWSNSTNTYTVPVSGLYLVHGVATCQNFSGEFRLGALINGTTYWGPRAIMPGSGEAGGAKTQIFALNAGDTIQLVAWPSVAATLSSLHNARLIVMQVANIGAPAVAVTPPDTTYRWTAGTQGPIDPLFNAHVANDLEFLTFRPYLMVRQGTVQTGIGQNAATPITMDTVNGQPHNTSGDNYSGWNAGANKYVAPVSGWYMAVEEIFLNQPSLTANPWVTAAFSPNPNGQTSWDTFQRQNMATSGQYPGAMGLTYYYLRAGDSIQPGVVTGASSSTTISTAVGAPGINSHFELVWLGE